MNPGAAMNRSLALHAIPGEHTESAPRCECRLSGRLMIFATLRAVGP